MPVTTWNPARLVGTAALSGGNLTLALPAHGDCAVTTVARGASGGKWQAELTFTSSGPSMNPVFGLKALAAPMPTGGGDYLFGPGDTTDFGFAGTGNKVAGGGVINPYGSTPWGIATGVAYVLGLLWDSTARDLRFVIDGVDQGIAWTAADFGALSDWYIVAGKTGVDLQTVVLNGGASSFAHPAVGYNSWNFDGSPNQFMMSSP